MISEKRPINVGGHHALRVDEAVQLGKGLDIKERREGLQVQMIAEYLLENWHTVMLVIFTAILSWCTWRLAVETKRLGRIQIEPRISIRAEWDREEAYDLVVSNEGCGAAKNVRCVFEGDNSHFRNTLLLKNAPLVDELHFIRYGIDHLEPGQTYRYLIGGSGAESFEAASKSPWVFRLQYENLYGEKRKDTQVIEFSLFKGDFAPPNRLKEVATSLREIHKTLKNRG